MERSQSIFSFYVRTSLWLALLCTVLIGVVPALGYGTPRRIIACAIAVELMPRLHLMDVGRGIILPISDIPIYTCCPKWSPDGIAVAFSGDYNHTYIVDVYGGGTRALSPDLTGWVMGWSAD